MPSSGQFHRHKTLDSLGRGPILLGRRAATALAGTVLLLAALIPSPMAAAAPEGLLIESRVLLEGNARQGAWMAIEVHLRNDGPPIQAELRLTGGAEARTRFGTPVDLPTQSDKVYVLYAQPPAFGSNVEIRLEQGGNVLAEQDVPYKLNDADRALIGVVAERPERIVPALAAVPSSGSAAPTIVALGIDDLPERVEAWSPLDRLVWQDVDAGQLTGGQRAALRGWLALGGRLVVAGGTGGPGLVAGFAEEGVLPYRPTSTLDVPPDALTAVLGEAPEDATELPALAGELDHGTALARLGDQAVVAERPYGSGAVTIVGFDPAAEWLAEEPAGDRLWQRLLPARTANPLVLTDDSQLLQAARSVPALALPPIGGLLALLIGYIVLIGPVNYIILRRLDRREWAWVTMPILIAVFAAGSYAYGAVLRGVDVIVNEVAIVRGAPDATEGHAQVYLAVFSPTRGTYQVEVPGGALLSSTISGEFASGSGSRMDVLQGDPSRVRDLAIGVTDVRALRAETPTTVPLVHAELELRDETLVGTISNQSEQALEKPAIVFGNAVQVLEDIGPGEERAIQLRLGGNMEGLSLPEEIVGTVFVGGRDDDLAGRNQIRYQVISQLTSNPEMGPVALPDEPVLLAWGRDRVLDVRVQGEAPRHSGNVLYYFPLDMDVSGTVTFGNQLLRQTVVESDANFFNIDVGMVNMGIGSATLAWRPIPFEGSLAADRLVITTGLPGEFVQGGLAQEIEPLGPACAEPDVDDCERPTDPTDPTDPTNPIDPTRPEPPCDVMAKECFPEFGQSLPQVEVFDVRGEGSWVRLPELQFGRSYAIASPANYIDPSTGTVMFRFVNEVMESAFNFDVSMRGEIR